MDEEMFRFVPRPNDRLTGFALRRMQWKYIFKHIYSGMVKPKRRVSPRLTNRVNRDLDHLMALSIVSVVERAKPPWERNSVERPCWDPKVEAICLFMKVFTTRSYDGSEAYLKTNAFIGQQLKLTRLPGHGVIARSMAKMLLSFTNTVATRYRSDAATGHGCCR